MWTAIVPLKLGGPRKSRLSARLSPGERERLADALFARVLAVLAGHPDVGEVVVLAPADPGTPQARWHPDGGGGLNAELEALRRSLAGHNLLVVHADLPFLGPDDVSALLKAAADGIAVAGDRAETGTNALAVRAGRPLPFAFGPGSLAAHLAAAGPAARLVARPGLAFDIDTPDDLDAALARGFCPGG
ncbi:MAG TPA: 2-phospho-L-lactate guanylyltransferase [Azospirillaceae bacterium]|nr:2-phospho-L-lactate guanylyltransferase [Azospirillaceae bacterium]